MRALLIVLALALAGCQTAPDAPEPVGAARVELERLKCEKGGGIYGAASATGAFACIRQTRDAGKQCHKESDCEGRCLARSGTCAPLTPLFGCNEILTRDGKRMTLCID